MQSEHQHSSNLTAIFKQTNLKQGSLHYTPAHCLVNGGFPLFWYLLRSPVKRDTHNRRGLPHALAPRTSGSSSCSAQSFASALASEAGQGPDAEGQPAVRCLGSGS